MLTKFQGLMRTNNCLSNGTWTDASLQVHAAEEQKNESDKQQQYTELSISFN